MDAARMGMKPAARSAIAAIAAALLSACAAQRPDTAPQIETAAAFRHAPDGGAATVPAPALDRWWLQFEDPDLTRLIELALAQNLDLQAAVARVEQARAAAGIAGAALLPRLDAQASFRAEQQSLESPLGRIGSRFPGYDRSPVLRSEALAASWELDIGGGLRSARDQRRAEAEVAQAQQLGVRVSLVAEVADSYFRVRGARLRLALAERRLRDDRELLRLVLARREDGLATLGEQAQAEARVAQVEAGMPALQAQIETQLNRIDVLLGVTPGSTAGRIATSTAPLRTPALAGRLSPAELLRRRPDVVAAERRLAAAGAGVQVARAEYYPKASLSVLLGMESLRTGVPSGANFQPAALLGLRWRLFDFGAIDMEVARATAARREALLAYRQAMLRATEDVENGLLASSWLRAEQAALARQAEAAGRARDQAHEAYVGGAASLMDELELERDQLDAQDRLAQSETEAGRALVATFRALGGGW